MKSVTLDRFFQTVGPFLEGRTSHDDAREHLYGDDTDGPDARRIGIYARFCRIHRFEAVDRTFVHCRNALIALSGESAWASLVEDYFHAHPMRHFELNENGAALPAFLVERDGDPAWLAELADFELWEWRTQSALDATEGEAPRDGALWIASTVELRPYRWDFVTWLDQERHARAPAPEERDCFVLFWRDADLDSRRDLAEPDELAVLKLVSEGTPFDDAAARALGTTGRVLEAARSRLIEAGILVAAGNA